MKYFCSFWLTTPLKYILSLKISLQDISLKMNEGRGSCLGQPEVTIINEYHRHHQPNHQHHHHYPHLAPPAKKNTSAIMNSLHHMSGSQWLYGATRRRSGQVCKSSKRNLIRSSISPVSTTKASLISPFHVTKILTCNENSTPLYLHSKRWQTT